MANLGRAAGGRAQRVVGVALLGAPGSQSAVPSVFLVLQGPNVLYLLAFLPSRGPNVFSVSVFGPPGPQNVVLVFFLPLGGRKVL